jgi:hypothetical protein
MIGNFLYSNRARPDDVTVWLQRGGDHGAARIILPSRLERMLADSGYPPPAPSMSIESALSYAIFLAIRTQTPLVIAGDRDVWNPDWGYLTDLGQFPTTGLVSHSDGRTRD